MSYTLLDGRKAREALLPELIQRIKKLSHIPTLAIIQVGNRADSTSFIGAKKAFAKIVGVNERHIQLPETISQKELVEVVQKCNADTTISGIIMQLPLPLAIDIDVIINTIDPRKDVDGLTSYHMKQSLEGGGDAIMPATARGIRELLGYYKIGLSGKKVTIVGRSMLVGKPIATMCKNENAVVTVCHSKTPDLVKDTQSADIVISAVGKADLIGIQNVRDGQVIIDVGITRVSDGKIVGDVDFEAVKDRVAAITPVPGGVGPMTVFALFENLVDLCSK